MKKFLARLLYPKIFKQVDYYRETIRKLQKDKSSLILAGERAEKIKDRIQNITEKGYMLVSLKESNGELLFIYRPIYSYDLYLSRSFITHHDVLMSIAYNRQEKRFFITDIEMSINYANRGYGSILMQELIKTAHTIGVKKICGDIAPVDWDHVDRLERFYRKHNFHVTLNHEKKLGFIKRELK